MATSTQQRDKGSWSIAGLVGALLQTGRPPTLPQRVLYLAVSVGLGVGWYGVLVWIPWTERQLVTGPVALFDPEVSWQLCTAAVFASVVVAHALRRWLIAGGLWQFLGLSAAAVLLAAPLVALFGIALAWDGQEWEAPLWSIVLYPIVVSGLAFGLAGLLLPALFPFGAMSVGLLRWSQGGFQRDVHSSNDQ